MISKIKTVLILLLGFLIYSCSSDSDSIPENEETFNINNLDITVTNIGEESALINLKELPSGNSPSIPVIIEYKADGAQNYTTSSSTSLTGLIKGKKYFVRALVKTNGTELRTEPISFVTLPFTISGIENLIGEELVVNQKFKISSIQDNSNFSEAPEIQIFIKVGNDSIAALEPKVLNNKDIEFMIPNNGQDFFNAESPEYEEFVDFKVTIQSGDFVTEAIVFPSFGSDFKILNETPRIRYINFHYKNFCTRNNNGGSDLYDAVEFLGFFWSYSDFNILGPTNQGAVNNDCCFADEINIRITNVDDPSITRTFFLIDGKGDGTSECEIGNESGFVFLRDFSYSYNKLHWANKLRISLLNTYFVEGDYTLEFNVTNNGKDYLSNKFPFTLTSETKFYNPPVDNLPN